MELQSNGRMTSPDYKHYDKEQVLKDFLEHTKHYEKRYETIDEDLEPDFEGNLKLFTVFENYSKCRI